MHEEGNACWRCQYIVHCRPTVRPSEACERFKPLGRVISQTHIAEWLGFDRNHLCYIIRKYGLEKVVELLETRGHMVRYELINQNVRFYWLGERG